MNIKIIIILLVLAILLTACGGGKGVYGKVTDEDAGEPVAGASVKLDCTDCDSDFSAQTDADGNYGFPDAPAGNYLLTIVWDNPPECPGIAPYETLGSSGEFVVTYAGYVMGGLGGLGNKRVIAVAEFQLGEGQGKKLNLEVACP